MATISEYLNQNVAGVIHTLVGVWVRLSNNKTSSTYVSTAVTDGNGLFTVLNVPAGLYTVATGPSATGPWTNTGDNSFNVPDEPYFFNVADYGAVGDGVTDDATAIQATITAIPSTGGTLWFPSTITNVYLVGSKIRINTAKVIVQFGGGVTLKSKNSLNDTLFWISASNVVVTGGIFDGNKANNTSGDAVLIDGAGTTISNITIRNSVVQNSIGVGVAIKASTAAFNTTDVVIERAYITNTNTAVQAVVRTAGTVDMVTVRDCTVDTTVQHGINVTGANRSYTDGNKLLNVGLNKVSGFSHAIAIDGNSGTNPSVEHRVTNNRIINPYDAGIEVADSITTAFISGNTVSGAGNGASAVNTYGIYFGGGLTLSTRAQIVGNTVTLSKGHGIMVGGPDGSHLTTSVSVVGNTSILNGNNGIYLFNVNIGEVTGNTSQNNSTLASNSFSGVDLNNVTRVVASNNVLTDTQGVPTQSRAINERGASDYNELQNNLAYGNVTSPYILVVGTHTVNRGNQGDTGNIEIYNVKDYGAKGDGVADDAGSIVAAITSATTPGGTIFFPSGTYLISTALTIPANVSVQGAGIDVTTLKIKSGSFGNFPQGTYMIQAKTTVTVGKNSRLSDLTLNGNHASGTASANQGGLLGLGDGTSSGAGNNWVVERVRFTDPNSRRVFVYTCTNVRFKNCRWDSTDSGDISDEFGGGSNNDLLVEGCFWDTTTGHGGGTTFDNTNGSNIKFINNTVLGPGRVIYEGITDSTIKNNYIRGGIWLLSDYFYNLPINVYPRNTVVEGNVIDGTVTTPSYGILVGYLWEVTSGTNLLGGANTIKNNTIDTVNKAGIVIVGNVATATVKSMPDVIEGNTIRNPNTDSSTSSTIGQGTGFTQNAGVAIEVGNGDIVANNVAVDDRGGSAKMAFGFCVGASGSSATVLNQLWHGNVSKNALTNPFSIQANAATSCVIKNNPGYNPQGVASITVTASPFTYTNADRVPEFVTISAGTVSSVAKDSNTLYTATNTAVWLEPTESVVVTYSVAPTMNKDRK